MINDIINDNRLDIIVLNQISNDVSVFLGQGNGSFSQATSYSVGYFPSSIAMADFNNDTQLDLIVANTFGNDVSVLLGYGDGSFVQEKQYSTGDYPLSVAVGDFNNDNRLDFVVANAVSNNTVIFTGYIEKDLVKKTTLQTVAESKPKSLVISDFNNDHINDIVTINSNSYTIGIFLGYGNFSFTRPIEHYFDRTLSPCAVTAGDFNDDVLLDLVITSCNSDFISVLFGLGNGSFGNLVNHSIGSYSSHHSLSVVDINNDTHLDIVVTNLDSNSIDVLRGYGNGSFSTVLSFQLEYGSNPFSTMFGDLNGDGKVDMAMINNGTDSLSVLLQTCSDFHG